MTEGPRRASRAGLTLCPACGNHVRAADAACPFCAGARAAAGPGLGLRDLGRAGLVAGALLIAPGCGDDDPKPGDAADTSDAATETSDATTIDTTEVVEDVTIVPLYGPPPQDAN